MTTSVEIKKVLKENQKYFAKRAKDCAWKNTISSAGFYQGIEAGYDYDTIKRSWERFPYYVSNNFYGCYAGYLSGKDCKKIKETGLYFYVAYFLMPIWFPEVVKEFNDWFKNIQLEILDVKTQPVYFNEGVKRIWTATSQKNIRGYTLEFRNRGGSFYKDCLFPIVKFHYSEKYEPIIRFHLNYSLVILFRMLSYSEKYHHLLQNKPHNKLEYLVRLNNRNKGYRSFSEKNTSLEQIKLLDDIDLVNSNVDKIYHERLSPLKQTDLVNVMTGGDYKMNPNFKNKLKGLGVK
ncbi:MAG: hypothetical protein BV456_01680 [Thermoplasmata archaeon M8B2D]|nr:MAG: hypothetical protein BV456_01680 [Thermoplasmata archaeon M8B2D]